MGFGRHVGLENRAKSEKKSIEKRIEKMMKKDAFWKLLGGGNKGSFSGVLGGRRGGDAPPRRPSDVLGVLWGRLRAVSGALEALVGKRKQRAGS